MSELRQINAGKGLISIPYMLKNRMELLIRRRNRDRFFFASDRINVFSKFGNGPPPKVLEPVIERGKNRTVRPSLKALADDGHTGGSEMPAVKIVDQLLYF